MMWSDAQRELLDAILDEFIPPSDDGVIPGAGALGVAEFLTIADAYAPDPAGSVQIILDAVAGNFCDLTSNKKLRN